MARFQMDCLLFTFGLHHVGSSYLRKAVVGVALLYSVARGLSWRAFSVTAISFFLALNGCFAHDDSGGRGEQVLDDDDFFAAPPPSPALLPSDPGLEVVLYRATAPLRLLLIADWQDQFGEHYYPSVHLQCRAWNDDTVTAWVFLSMDDFVIIRDTLVVHLDRLLVIDASLNGANFSFRARLMGAGVSTDWVRLKESVRFYDRERRGVPRQPRELRLLR